MSENHPSCAVIILNWNGATLLRKYLPSVVANTGDVGHVIVADNGSDDDSLKVLAEEFPEVEVWPFDRNHGFAGGYNIAVKRAAEEGYPYAVLLNSDVRTPEGWLEPLIDFMNKNRGVAAAQPKILSDTKPDTFEYAGAAGGLIDRHGFPYCRGRILGKCEKDHGQYDTPMYIFWASGAAMAVRTDLYLKVGGLDEKFFAHMEEIDLCWRLTYEGYTIYCVPSSHVYHLGGGSLPAGNPRKTYLNFRNNLLLLHKNLPDETREKKLRKRRLIDTLAFVKFALTFNFANARAVWRAHRDFARMQWEDYGRYKHPRLDLLDWRDDTQRDILVDYYLRGRRTF